MPSLQRTCPTSLVADLNFAHSRMTIRTCSFSIEVTGLFLIARSTKCCGFFIDLNVKFCNTHPLYAKYVQGRSAELP